MQLHDSRFSSWFIEGIAAQPLNPSSLIGILCVQRQLALRIDSQEPQQKTALRNHQKAVERRCWIFNDRITSKHPIVTSADLEQIYQSPGASNRLQPFLQGLSHDGCQGAFISL